jgi:transposase
MARIAKKTKRYPSDLTDEEWARIAPLMPKSGRRGRPREVDFREVNNAVRYLVRVRGAVGGCCQSTLVPGRQSTAGSASWRGAFCFRPFTM